MWIEFTARLALAFVLALSGIGKLLDSSSFREALDATGIGRLPAIVVIVPAVEIAVCGALMLGTPTTISLAMVLAAGLFLAFTGWVMAVIRSGRAVACGCFGTSRSTVTWRTALRNIALLVFAALTLVGTRMVDPVALPARPTGFAVLGGALLLVALGAAFRISRPHLTLRSDEALTS